MPIRADAKKYNRNPLRGLMKQLFLDSFKRPRVCSSIASLRYCCLWPPPSPSSPPPSLLQHHHLTASPQKPPLTQVHNHLLVPSAIIIHCPTKASLDPSAYSLNGSSQPSSLPPLSLPNKSLLILCLPWSECILTQWVSLPPPLPKESLSQPALMPSSLQSHLALWGDINVCVKLFLIGQRWFIGVKILLVSGTYLLFDTNVLLNVSFQAELFVRIAAEFLSTDNSLYKTLMLCFLKS